MDASNPNSFYDQELLAAHRKLKRQLKNSRERVKELKIALDAIKYTAKIIHDTHGIDDTLQHCAWHIIDRCDYELAKLSGAKDA